MTSIAINTSASRRTDVAWWGMLLFLINESALFAALIASYFFLAMPNMAWPPPGVGKPALALPLTMTLALVSSSGALVLADRALQCGNRIRFRSCLALTVLLGLAFLGMQTKEYLDKLKHLGPTQNSYGSIFYTITGLHGAHVAFGLLFLLWGLAREMNGSAGADSPGLKNASLYWHFVDGVWIVILTSLYLSPRWM